MISCRGRGQIINEWSNTTNEDDTVKFCGRYKNSAKLNWLDNSFFLSKLQKEKN